MAQHIEIILPEYRRGFHLITNEIVRSLPDLPDVGIAHVFINHTSAGLTINENADPDVRYDFHQFINRLVPENAPYYSHILEGSDDMPAHIKASLVGQSVSIPVNNGRLSMGTWQGLYLCEFRDRGGSRKLTVTILP